MRFNMKIMKPINIPLYFHCSISSSLCHDNKEEKDYVSTLCKLSRMVDVFHEMFEKFTCIWCCQWKHGKTMQRA